jgi:hypothetical protein
MGSTRYFKGWILFLCGISLSLQGMDLTRFCSQTVLLDSKGYERATPLLKEISKLLTPGDRVLLGGPNFLENSLIAIVIARLGKNNFVQLANPNRDELKKFNSLALINNVAHLISIVESANFEAFVSEQKYHLIVFNQGRGFRVGSVLEHFSDHLHLDGKMLLVGPRDISEWRPVSVAYRILRTFEIDVESLAIHRINQKHR